MNLFLGMREQGQKAKLIARCSPEFFFWFFLDIFILFKWDCDPIYEYGGLCEHFPGPTIYTLLETERSLEFWRGWSILYLAHFEATSVTSG